MSVGRTEHSQTGLQHCPALSSAHQLPSCSAAHVLSMAKKLVIFLSFQVDHFFKDESPVE